MKDFLKRGDFQLKVLKIEEKFSTALANKFKDLIDDKNKNLTQLLISAAESKNMKAIDSIDTLQKRVLAGSYLATVNFALNNKEYEIAPFLALSEIYNANTKYLDTIYNTLTPKIKESTYGIALKEFISQTKSQDSL